MRMIKPLQNAYEQFRRLPGIGSKTAMRLAYHVMDMSEADVGVLAETLIATKRSICLCKRCFNLSSSKICDVCSEPSRDQAVICVVEQPQDVMAMENSRSFNGLYHVLHGVLSPLDGIGPNKLKMKELVSRIGAESINEVIIATNSDVEGEATAVYLAQTLKPLGVKVSRIAHGLPVGGDLEYADEVTLSRALENRREM